MQFVASQGTAEMKEQVVEERWFFHTYEFIWKEHIIRT